MRLPRQWVLGLGLLAAAPAVGTAGPFDTLSSQPAAPQQTAPASAADTILARQIAGALKGADLQGQDVKIEVKDGRAVVGGQIADASQKARVSELVSNVPGVSGVQNNMSLMAAAAPQHAVGGVQQAGYTAEAGQDSQIQTVGYNETMIPPEPATTKRSNQAVAEDIAGALTQAGLNKYDVEIRYKDSVCTLIGAVGQVEEAARAVALCRQIDGVSDVDNRLTVAGLSADRVLSRVAARGPVPPSVEQAGYAPQTGFAPQAYAPQGPTPAQQQQYLQMMQQAQAAQAGIRPTAAYGPGPGPQQAPGAIQQVGGHFNRPSLPNHAWPAYAAQDNYAAVTYPSQYDASAFPYIGPFYPYPQVPLGWREAELSWDDGQWNLEFDSRTDKWWWFLNPSNWH